MQTVDGECVSWDDNEGWGVLRSDEVESELFAHFADLVMPGLHTLRAGQRVRFEVEPFPSGQDGYVYRAHDVTPL